MSAEVINNVQLREIFQNAGCQSLFELYEKVNGLAIKHPPHSLCRLVLDYLGYNNVPVSEEEFI